MRKWLEADKLALNIQQRKMTDQMFLKIGNKKIKQESSVYFLGVLSGFTLSWKYHLAELSKKLATTAGIFYKTTVRKTDKNTQ